eukprot:UN26216
MWGLSIIWSRTFQIPMPDDTYEPALCPFGDMLNYSGAKFNVVSHADPEYKYFLFKTISPITTGSQLFADYGEKENYMLLMDYGFTVLENPNDHIVLSCENILWSPVERLEFRIQLAEYYKFYKDYVRLKVNDTEIPRVLLICTFLAVMPNPDKFHKRMKNVDKHLNNFNL